MEKLFKKRDIIIIAALVVLAAAFLFFTPKTKGNIAVVTYDGKEVLRADLSKDKTYSISADLPVTLEVKDGKIHFVGSRCPDKLCEGFGLIGEEYEYAVCMPARVAVQIVAG